MKKILFLGFLYLLFFCTFFFVSKFDTNQQNILFSLKSVYD